MHVVRGKLPAEFFAALTIPEYQRNAMPGVKHAELVEAFDPDEGSGVPSDALLCVRGDDTRATGGGEIVIRSGELIVLDGHQRIDALLDRVRNKLPVNPLGAKVLLGTTADEEKALFYQENRKQTRVATPVFVRNSDDTDAIAALRLMVAASPDFVTVQWDQERPRGPHITALMLYQVASILHGYPLSDGFEEIIKNLDAVTDEIGTEQLVENMQTFFDVAEQCLGKQDRRRYTYRIDVLRALALLFRDHRNFWAKNNQNKLQVIKDDLTKIRSLALTRLQAALGQTNKTTSLAHTWEAHINATRDKPLERKPSRRRTSD